MMFHGSRIREARGKMSRAELARRIARQDERLVATSAQQIQRWENGQRPRYEAETVAAIASATGRSVDFFLEASREESESRDDEDPSVVDMLAELRSELREINRMLAAAA